MVTIFNYFLVFNIFAGGFLLFVTPFDFYTGYIFIITFLIAYIIRYRNLQINSWFLMILILLTIVSLGNAYVGKDTFFLMSKQLLGILITGSAYYLLVKANEFNVEKLFKIYLQIALIIAAIGIIQELSFLVKIKSGYDYSWIVNRWKYTQARFGILRINSICMEPAHFAITMIPAVFVSLSTIFKRGSFYLSKWKCVLIIISVILSLSSIAYIAILISLLLIFLGVKKSKYLLLVIVIIPALIYSAYRYIPEIRERANHTIGVFTGQKKVSQSHLSVYALASNAFVAYKSFIDSPLFGRGLGSHPVSYNEFIKPGVPGTIWYSDYPKYPAVNREDAGSLFLRLVSETGLFGLIVVFYFIFKFHLKGNDDEKLQIISNAIFVLFLLQLFRQGHYFYNGLFFFVWVYYFAYRICKNRLLA